MSFCHCCAVSLSVFKASSSSQNLLILWGPKNRRWLGSPEFARYFESLVWRKDTNFGDIVRKTIFGDFVLVIKS